VLRAGSVAQAAKARRILTDMRRLLYRILAEDDSGGKAAESPKKDHE
jgi:hypothetical protein